MAQLDTSIAFSGYVPNFANALASGAQAAAMRNEMTRQNALANVYQTQGAGILSGDQAALNALAGVGEVGQAIGVMDTRQGMDARALQMDATRQDMDIQMREWALRLDAAEREQRLAEGQQMLSGMIAASTSPQAWDAWAASTGQTQLIGQHGQSQTYIANLLPPLEALEMVQGQAAQRQERKVDSKAQPDAQSAIAKLQQDFNNGLISEEQLAIAMQGLAPTGTAINVTPGGGVTVAQGPGVQGAVNIPERQSQIQLFGTMMDVAAPVINQIEMTYDPANLPDAAARALGIPGNFLQSQQGQQYKAAATAWAEGALRLATGAAATPQEIQRITETYFAQPGDTPDTVAFKRQLRAAYESAIVAASGGNFQPGAAELPPDPLAGANATVPDPMEFANQAGADTDQPAGPITADAVPTMPEDALAQYLLTTPPNEIPDDVWSAIAARTGVE